MFEGGASAGTTRPSGQRFDDSGEGACPQNPPALKAKGLLGWTDARYFLKGVEAPHSLGEYFFRLSFLQPKLSKNMTQAQNRNASTNTPRAALCVVRVSTFP